MHPCSVCCEPFDATGRTGRPRTKCFFCSPPRPGRILTGREGSARMVQAECQVCREHFSKTAGNALKIYCSRRCAGKARDRKRSNPCVTCGKPMYYAKGLHERPMCQPCRRARPGYRDKSRKAPIQQWTCGRCGVECSRPTVRGVLPTRCRDCKRPAIRVTVRRAVYERDNWNCGICEEPVDASLIGSQSIWRPSLDHIVPHAIGGSDEPENLRLAHFWCNCVRADERAYTDDDFRGASVRAA